MKLFYSPGSCSLAVHILLEEISRPYKLELVSTKEGKNQSPEYLAINPKGRVPTLEVKSGVMLTETPAILVYLARTNPSFKILPNEPLLEARCLEWLNWLSGTVHTFAFGQVWRPARFLQNEDAFSELLKNGTENILKYFSLIERQIINCKWAVGNTYSVVDPYLLVFYYWGQLINLDMKAFYPNWYKHAANLMQRKAVIAALKQEGISIL